MSPPPPPSAFLTTHSYYITGKDVKGLCHQDITVLGQFCGEFIKYSAFTYFTQNGSFCRYHHQKRNKGTKQQSSPGGFIVWLYCFLLSYVICALVPTEGNVPQCTVMEMKQIPSGNSNHWWFLQGKSIKCEKRWPQCFQSMSILVI